MDHGRKIGKPNSSSKIIENRSLAYCTAFDPPVIAVDPVIEDRRLINWKKWLSDRNKHYQRYKSISGRHQTKLTMNSSESYRPLVEMRDLMDYATLPIPALQDKYRGNPAFFKMPNSLSNREDDCLPDVFVTLTKKDLNIAPELTHVALPTLIEKEKNLVCRKKCEPSWKRSKYLQKRENQLAETISILKPNEPEVKELMIKGERICGEKQQKFQKVPVISISERIEEEIEKSIADQCEAVILKIQDREINRDENRPSVTKNVRDPLQWNFTFEATCGSRSEQKIILENKGTVVIEYQWREESCTESIVPSRRRKSSFYFNKNNVLILPGQIIQIPIWFHTNDAGIHLEKWRLETEPKLHESPLLFRFCGFASSTELMDERNNSIEEYLNDCIKRATITEIIKDLVNSVQARKPKDSTYNSMFLERDLFAAKNPLYYYHSNIVHELKTMYNDVTSEDSPPWNFSLTDLREIFLKIVNPNERQEKLLRFSQLIRESLKPSLPIFTSNNDKYTAVYNILCSFANKFEDESEFVHKCCASKCNMTSCTNDQGDASRSRTASSQLSAQTGRRSKRLSQSLQIQETSPVVETRKNSRVLEENDNLYGQIYFVRIYGHLAEAIDQACAMIDSLENLNEFDN